jgi:coenzyme A diphosphatase NUDT7
VSGPLDALRRRYQGHTPGLMGARHEYAVLFPLVQHCDGLHLLLEVRAASLPQGGEVCLPGGRKEPEESPVQCALRETEEELAIPRREIEILGTSDFICNQRGFLLRPVLGAVSPAGMAAMRPSPAEVAEAFTVPLAFFRETPPQVYSYDLIPQPPAEFPFASVGIRPDYPWPSGRVELPVWHWQGHVIWGMTARIIRDILSE